MNRKFVCVILLLVIIISLAGYESGYWAALSSPKVQELENNVKTLKAENSNMISRIMHNLENECMTQANGETRMSNRTDWSVTIIPNNSTLTVYTIIRYGEQGNGTMITCQ